MKDMIWKGTTKLTGPRTLYIVTLHNDRKIYIFGESHSENGDSKHTYAPQQVLDTFADKTLDILIELSKDYALFLSFVSRNNFSVTNKNTSRSPLEYVSNRYYLHPQTISKNHTIKYIDTRRFSPFVLLTSIYDFGTYVYVFHKLNYMEKTPELAAVQKTYKEFERELFSHIKSRAGLKSLLMDLIHPENELPQWYKDWLIKTNHSYEHKDNVLKTELAELKKTNLTYYEDILAYIDFELAFRLDSRTDFSARFESADKQRLTASEHFIMDKKKNIENYFSTLIGILADVYILLCIRKNTNDTVLFVGDSHVKNITRFYKGCNVIKKIDVFVRTDENDYLDCNVKQEYHMF